MLPIALDAALEPFVQVVEVAQASNAVVDQKPIIATVCGVVTDKSRMVYKPSLYMEIYQLLRRLGLKESSQIHSSDEERAVNAAAKIMKDPENGTFEYFEDPVMGEFIYEPNPDFMGEDHFTVQTMYKERKFTLNFRILVFEKGAQDWSYQHDCSEPPFAPYPDDPVSWYRTNSLQALLSGAKDALASFADLTGASLAQATGSKITLDSTAACHGWFIDYTPYINEE